MNYVKTINRITDTGTARYRGLNLKRKNGFWICLGVECRDFLECDKVIAEAGNSLSNSVNRVKK
jgi:hypothetical protein